MGTKMAKYEGGCIATEDPYNTLEYRLLNKHKNVSIKQLHKAIIYSSEAWDYEICIEESSNSIQKLYMFDLNFDSKIERKSLNKLELINIALNIGPNCNKRIEYEDELLFKEFYKNEKYLQEKSSYQSQIENLFKESIILEDKFNIRKYSDYIYHYTDAESALSILADEAIYPSLFKNDKCVHLTDIEPNNTDLNIGAILFCSKLYKLQFAFGFKKDEISKIESTILKEERNLPNLKNEIYFSWKIPTDIKIKKSKVYFGC